MRYIICFLFCSPGQVVQHYFFVISKNQKVWSNYSNVTSKGSFLEGKSSISWKSRIVKYYYYYYYYLATKILPLFFFWVSLPETNSSPLKIDPWKRRFLLETSIFGGQTVSFREGIPPKKTTGHFFQRWQRCMNLT